MTNRPPQSFLPVILAFLLVAAAGTSHAEMANIEPGTPGVVVTVIQGHRTQEIPLHYLGLLEDFAGPGYDLHLVELEGEIAENVGVAAGMSGSPVYIDGKLIGALAYRFGFMPKQPVAGVTPIETILDAARGPATGAGKAGDRVAPITTPVMVGGMTPAVQGWLNPQLAERGFTLVAGVGSGTSSREPEPLRPGSPVGVQLMRGDIRVAATGTVTWVDGDRVYAFGHPFLGGGRTEMPMVAAEVVHTLADSAGSVKMANIGAEVGTIVEDRFAAVVGLTGRSAAMIPMEMTVRGADYGEQTYRFDLVKNSELGPLLVASAVANSLQVNNGYTRESTMKAHGRIRLQGMPDLPVEFAFAGGPPGDPSLALATHLLRTLALLWRNPFAKVQVEGIELTVETRPEIVSYELENIRFDRGKLHPGQDLEVECVLRKFRGERVVRRLVVPIPRRPPREGSLVLAVGSTAAVEAALGRPLTRRLESAADFDSLVAVLGAQESTDRLRAVVYEPDGAVVSRGELYAELPLTAERLLSRQSATRTAKPSPAVTPLVQVDQSLDGPLRGAKQVRLRLERGSEPLED